MLQCHSKEKHSEEEMIQDIYPHKLDIEYKSGLSPMAGDYLVRFEGMKFLCRRDEGDSVVLPQYSDLPENNGFESIYLFELDGKRMFLLMGEGQVEVDGFGYENINLFRNARPKELLFAVSTAFHLHIWHRDNIYCGRCGSKTVHDEKERMMRCPVCGNTIYPRIMPSVIVGVVNGDSILLTRYNRPGSRLAALVAGFCEIGETGEETVKREVLEETGLTGKNIRYFKSQPWGITAGGLLLGYWCEVDGDDTIRVDGEEIAEGVWMKREDLTEYMEEKEYATLTSEMISIFARNIYR